MYARTRRQLLRSSLMETSLESCGRRAGDVVLKWGWFSGELLFTLCPPRFCEADSVEEVGGGGRERVSSHASGSSLSPPSISTPHRYSSTRLSSSPYWQHPLSSSFYPATLSTPRPATPVVPLRWLPHRPQPEPGPRVRPRTATSAKYSHASPPYASRTAASPRSRRSRRSSPTRCPQVVGASSRPQSEDRPTRRRRDSRRTSHS